MATSSCLLSLKNGLALCLSVALAWDTNSPSPWLFVLRTVSELSELSPLLALIHLGLLTPPLALLAGLLPAQAH